MPDLIRLSYGESCWPDHGANGPTTFSSLSSAYKPRSGVLVITKNDDGVIGT